MPLSEGGTSSHWPLATGPTARAVPLGKDPGMGVMVVQVTCAASCGCLRVTCGKQREAQDGGGCAGTVSPTCQQARPWPQGRCWPRQPGWAGFPAVLAASGALLCLAQASAGPSAEQGLVPGLAVSAPGLSPGPTAASPSIPVPHLSPLVEQWLLLAGLPVGIRLLLLPHCGSALMNTGHNHPGELLPPEKLLPPQRAALLGVTAAGIWKPQGHDTDPRHNGLWA